MIRPEQFEALLPLACRWAEEQESVILQKGVPLTRALLADARVIGIAHPDRVRLHVVSEMPAPRDPVLWEAAETTGLLTPVTAGLTLRYGIFVHADSWGDRRLVVHELVHTRQYEQLGGFRPFLEKYLRECLTLGYPNAPMEQEARRIEREICS
jgi:hypothetical protein